jgi:hypothetical protein
MAMLVDLGCQVHVNIKKSTSVQASRGIVVLVALNMAVLPADGATYTGVADHQDQVKVLGYNREALRFIETSLQCCSAVKSNLNGSLVNLVEFAEGVYTNAIPYKPESSLR